MKKPIFLASENSAARRLLGNAGITVEVMAADLDDRALEEPLEETGASPEDFALVLAEAKATEVSGRYPGLLFLGCEQVCSLGDEILHAPADMEEARRRLLLLSGKTHHVTVAAALARDGEVFWRRTDVAGIAMLKLDPGFIGRYVAAIGVHGLQTANICRIDGAGLQLVEAIEGDAFTAAGVPMLPLLAELRRIGAIDF
ncbi:MULTISPECIES: Maf family protein [unclassified Rhizobium]|uniref:Maf family protein n=1 Tax=unclassified Rhizobium TaxID=2613769 RepID=UPI0007015856|nr:MULTISPECIES: Maf family protein [unclassified Rhizobium]KQV40819.1 septum formation inhibitor Maf [Rhizobium sp. Root1212]KRD36107.1 septum formation inhibitor Maf [Rhizobium sp. Root268]